MTQWKRGQMTFDEKQVRHIDLCLGCRTCEAVCPSGVPYGRIIEAGRSEVERMRRPSAKRWVAKTALRQMITLIGERLGLSPEDAYMFCSLAVDMRVTQLVDGNKGIHAMLPKRYAPM